jgi:hypothetical protein
MTLRNPRMTITLAVAQISEAGVSKDHRLLLCGQSHNV